LAGRIAARANIEVLTQLRLNPIIIALASFNCLRVQLLQDNSNGTVAHRISTVVEDGPANRAGKGGLLVGDRILSANGVSLADGNVSHEEALTARDNHPSKPIPASRGFAVCFLQCARKSSKLATPLLSLPGRETISVLRQSATFYSP
jgi:hypothetical protein